MTVLIIILWILFTIWAYPLHKRFVKGENNEWVRGDMLFALFVSSFFWYIVIIWKYGGDLIEYIQFSSWMNKPSKL